MQKLNAATVFYHVQNMDRAVDFYTKTLGFPLKIRFGNNWAEVDAGTVSIGLHPTEDNAPVATEGGAIVSFPVENIESVVAELKSKDVKVSDIRTPPRGKFVMVTDTEGNSLHFIEFKKSGKVKPVIKRVLLKH